MKTPMKTLIILAAAGGIGFLAWRWYKAAQGGTFGQGIKPGFDLHPSVKGGSGPVQDAPVRPGTDYQPGPGFGGSP